MGDEELLRLLRENPEDGMAELIRQYSGVVYATARSRLPAGIFCVADVEACVADTFSKFYCELEKYDPGKGSIRAWLSVIARNNALDLVRHSARTQTVPLDEALLSDECELGVELEDREQRELLLAAVRELGEPDREIIVRKFYLGQPSREIGERLSLSAANVDTRTHRAIMRLRERLTGGG